jgi:hypothetical protein
MNDVTNGGFGPEAAMQLVDERTPHGFVRIGDAISREELDSIAGSFAAAAGLNIRNGQPQAVFVRPTPTLRRSQLPGRPLAPEAYGLYVSFRSN